MRELRAESRRPANYWLRLLAAAVLVLVFAVFMLNEDLPPSMVGREMFGALHQAFYWAIWVIVPLMTADCISQEKREGTLGLLFLTPLTVSDVILGKGAIHVLRACTLVAAALPVMVLPFLMGGLSWEEISLAVVEVVNALVLAIAAGLFASVKGGSMIQVMVMAELSALGLAVLSQIWIAMARNFASSGHAGLGIGLGLSLLLAFCTFMSVLRRCTKRLQRTWHQDSAAPEQPNWVKLFSTSEFWRTLFHWERGPALDRNPMAWLQEYSWTARLTKWGWFLSLFVVEAFMLVGFPGSQAPLTVALSMGVAFSAAASFRRERQSGLLEILLVTPISARQIMAGRLFGICAHFGPALTVLMICWAADRTLSPKYQGNALAWVVPNPMAFVALIMLGLYASLWRVGFFLGWLVTWGVAFLAPMVFTVWLSGRMGMHPSMIIGWTSAFQIGVAVVSWMGAERNIRSRSFLDRKATMAEDTDAEKLPLGLGAVQGYR